MGCELWIKGAVYFQGDVYPNYSRKVLDWTAGQTIPAITYSHAGQVGLYDYYIDDGRGGSSGSGWNSAPSYFLVGCGGVNPQEPYDCINGGCVPKTTYNTPGVFASLAACESGCAKDSNCTGECVSAAELAALQQAANNLKSRLCK
jgi:hypothetical protein